MRDGFVKIAAGTPKIKVADCMYNAEQIIALMKEAAGQGVKVLSLPGAVHHRLHLRRPVPPAHPAHGAEAALAHILEETGNLDLLTP